MNSRDNALVSPEWLEAHLNDPAVQVIEIAGLGQEQMQAFDSGHVPGALGWRKGKVGLISNKVKLSHSGLNTALSIDLTPPIRMRQTMRIGDDCATGVLECTTNTVQTVIKCTTPIFTP